MYNDFAYLYDRLIKQDIDYEKICCYIQEIFDRYGKSPSLICDLACGTGNVTVPMSQRGYDMIGVDVSEAMLDVARTKNTDSDIIYICQDMKKLDLFGTCDAFLCMTDGFNYITSINSVKSIFSKIRRCFIEQDGIFIFDISSAYKLQNTLGSNTYIYNTDDVFYTWENSFKNPLCKMELNFFVKDKENYRRFEEVHLQRAYTKEQIITTLTESGFTSVEVFGGYTFNAPSAEEKRLVFVATP